MLLQLFGRRAFIGRLRYQLFDRHYNQTLRIGLVILCLGLTLLSAFLYRGTELWGLDFLPGTLPVAAVVGLAVVVVFYNHLGVALLLVVIFSTTLATGISTGTGTSISLTFLLLNLVSVIWLFKAVVVERNFNLANTPVALPVALFVIVVLISLVWSSGYVEADARPILEDKLLPRLMTTAVLIVSPLTTLMFASQLRSTRHFQFIVWWFLAAGAVFLVLRLAAGYVPSPLNAKGQFPVWVCTLAVGQLLFNRRLSWPVRGVLVAIMGGWLYVTLALGLSWLSGWLPVVAGIMLTCALYSRRMLVLMIIIGLIVVALRWDSVEAQFRSENEESGSTRITAWQRTFDVIEDHWLLGTGPAGYAFYFTARLTGFFQFSHNNYIDILAQLGIIGFLVYVWMWIAINIISLKNYRSIPKDGGFRQGLAASLVAINAVTILIMMLGDWVTPFTYTQGLSGIDYTIWSWIFAGLTLALYGQRQSTAQPALQLNESNT